MLDLPVIVKERLKNSSHKKNFRVHFPNGERADIINSSIEQESVTLTESICSDSELRFGQCILPRLSFTVHNIENIKDDVVECFLELCEAYDIRETTPTGSFLDNTNIKKYGDFGLIDFYMPNLAIIPQGATIQIVSEAVMEDVELLCRNSLDEEWDWDNIGGGFEDLTYVNPNKFVKCVRIYYASHQPFEGEDGVDFTITNYLNKNVVFRDDLQDFVYPVPYGVYRIFSCKKQSDMTKRYVQAYGIGLKQGSASIDAWKKNNNFFSAEFNMDFDLVKHALGQAGVIEDALISEISAATEGTYSEVVYRGQGTRISVVYKVLTSTTHDFNALYRVKNEKHSLEDLLLNLEALADKYEIGDYDDLRTVITNFYNAKNSIKYTGANATEFDLDYNECFYPQWNTATAITIMFPWALHFERPNEGVEDYKSGYLAPYYDNFSEIVTPVVTCPTVIEGAKIRLNNVEGYIAEIPSDFTALDIREGMLELQGLCNKFDRMTGKAIAFSLKESFENPIPISKSEYTDLWYDDFYSKPIGRITVTYADPNFESQRAGVDFEGYDPETHSSYSIARNFLIDNGVYTSEQIDAIFDRMKSNISGISYMPARVTCVNMPWIEVGDVLDVPITANDHILVLVESRELHGIRFYTDEFECNAESEPETKETATYVASSETIVIS